MRLFFVTTLLCLTFKVHGALTQAYGVVKPSKALSATGILHFKENGGLELEGYFSKLDPKKSVVISLWSYEESKSSPMVVGPHSNERVSSQFNYPVKEICTLCEVTPNLEGYGEVNLKIKNLSLNDLNKEGVTILVYQKEEKLEGRLLDKNFTMTELRWIED